MNYLKAKDYNYYISGKYFISNKYDFLYVRAITYCETLFISSVSILSRRNRTHVKSTYLSVYASFHPIPTY